MAVRQYGFNPDDLVFEKELQSNTWHGDLHFKIHLKEKSFSARFISYKRYENNVFVKLTDEVLTEQIKFCNYLRESGIPFMKHRSTVQAEPFILINDGKRNGDSYCLSGLKVSILLIVLSPYQKNLVN
jgi:hypothetical protein